jgi:hypothetical protein
MSRWSDGAAWVRIFHDPTFDGIALIGLVVLVFVGSFCVLAATSPWRDDE